MRVFVKIKHLGNYPSQREYTGEPAVLVVAISTLSVNITGVPMDCQDTNLRVPWDTRESKTPMQSVCRGVSHKATLGKRRNARKGSN